MARNVIDWETVSTQPLIVIPVSFRLRTTDAFDTLQQVLKDSGCKKKLKVRLKPETTAAALYTGSNLLMHAMRTVKTTVYGAM